MEVKLELLGLVKPGSLDIQPDKTSRLKSHSFELW